LLQINAKDADAMNKFFEAIDKNKFKKEIEIVL
jgi:hypothetical protein